MTSSWHGVFERVQHRYSWWYATSDAIPSGQVTPKELSPGSRDHAQTVFRSILPGWWWIRVLVFSPRCKKLVSVIRAGSKDGKTRICVVDTDDCAADLYCLIDKAAKGLDK